MRNRWLTEEVESRKVTVAGFDDALARVISGETYFIVATTMRQTPITAKDIKKFEKAGYTLIAKSKDGKGFVMQRGKNKDFVAYGYLFELPA